MRRYRVIFKVGDDDYVEADRYDRPGDCYVFYDAANVPVAQYLASNVAGITIATSEQKICH